MNQKGVTIAALVITVIVLIILGTVSFSVGFQLMDFSRMRNTLTSLNLTRAEAEKIFDEFATEYTRPANGGNVEKIDTIADYMGETSAYAYLTLSNYAGEYESILSRNVSYATILAEISSKKVPPTAGELKKLNDDNNYINEYGYSPQQAFWYEWNDVAIVALKLDINALVRSSRHIYVNYYTGEVVIPDGVKADDGKMYYSISGLESEELVNSNNGG